jgi:hypothetical protein
MHKNKALDVHAQLLDRIARKRNSGIAKFFGIRTKALALPKPCD